MSTAIIVVLTLAYSAAGLVAQYFNIAHPTLDYQMTILDGSSTGSCGSISILCWQALANVMVFISNIFAYAVNFVIDVFNLLTWPLTMSQSHPNPYMYALAFLPLIVIGGLTLFKLIRSGSQE